MNRYKETFQEIYEEFVEENKREPTLSEMNDAHVSYYASWADHLMEESKYE